MRWIIFVFSLIATPWLSLVIFSSFSPASVASNEAAGHGNEDNTCFSVKNNSADEVGSKIPAGDRKDVNNDPAGHDESYNSNTCKLYMAPSSIPNAGYGVYTVKSFKKGEAILSNDGPNIPVIDPTIFGGSHLPILANLGHRNPKTVLDDTLADRNEDPGAGAFSYYLGKDFFAHRAIEAGEEIFLDYGEQWLDNRKEFEHVPRANDFDLAGQLLSNLLMKRKRC